MDDENYDTVVSLNPGGKARVVKMCDYADDPGVDHVPDPYYGGAHGFELVLDILEHSCANLLAREPS